MKTLKLIGFLLAIITSVINPIKSNAQNADVAGWKIEGMGVEEDRIRRVTDKRIMGMLFIQNGQTMFSIFDIDTKFNLLTIQLECLYFDQNAARNNNYLGMKSAIKALGEFEKKGWIYLNIHKTGDGFDIFHLDLTDETIIFTGHLLDENMMKKLSKLAAAGIILKDGAKLKVPLEQYLSEDN